MRKVVSSLSDANASLVSSRKYGVVSTNVVIIATAAASNAANPMCLFTRAMHHVTNTTMASVARK